MNYIQLSTGLIFYTEELPKFNDKGLCTILKGRINIPHIDIPESWELRGSKKYDYTEVKNFHFNGSNVIASWQQ